MVWRSADGPAEAGHYDSRRDDCGLELMVKAFLLIVVGLSGDPTHAETFQKWGAMLAESSTRLGIPREQMAYLVEKPVPGDKPSQGSCDAIKEHLGGSCAEPFASALADCFDPSGCMSFVNTADGVTSLRWENGARVDRNPATEEMSMYASNGRLCARATVRESGDTSRWSNVPISRSRATESPVIIKPISVVRIATSPGTVLHLGSRFSLNQTRSTTTLDLSGRDRASASSAS